VAQLCVYRKLFSASIHCHSRIVQRSSDVGAEIDGLKAYILLLGEGGIGIPVGNVFETPRISVDGVVCERLCARYSINVATYVEHSNQHFRSPVMHKTMALRFEDEILGKMTCLRVYYRPGRYEPPESKLSVDSELGVEQILSDSCRLQWNNRIVID
jgi:hypothetical protein